MVVSHHCKENKWHISKSLFTQPEGGNSGWYVVNYFNINRTDIELAKECSVCKKEVPALINLAYKLQVESC